MKNDKIFEKYISETTIVDYYITENIIILLEDNIFKNNIKENIILLGKVNKNGLNSLNILLENKKYDHIKEFIDFDYKILNYKNRNEKNIFQSLLLYIELTDYIKILIVRLSNENPLFLYKLLLNYDIYQNTFIDNCINILKINTNFNKIKNILDILTLIKNFYDNQSLKLINSSKINYTITLITKLCNQIKNNEYLYKILFYLDLKNFDIIPNNDGFICLDYLQINKNNYFWIIIEYLIDRANYIKFVNKDNNIIFSIIESIDRVNNISQEIIKKITKIFVNIIFKSNIFNIRDKYNNNFLSLILNKFNFSTDIVKELLKNNNFNLYEYNYPPTILSSRSINTTDITLLEQIPLENTMKKTNIYEILLKKYGKKFLKNINLKISKYDNYKKYYKKYYKIIKKLLISVDVGLFISNTMNNMIYTLSMLQKYNNLLLPNRKYNSSLIINEFQNLERCTTSQDIVTLINLYLNDYYTTSIHVIVWKDEDNYFISDDLLKFINDSILNYKKDKKRYIYIKLSIIISKYNLRHANLLLIDLENKIVDRFEPYGEIYFNSTIKIDEVIKKEIADNINFKYNSIQPYPGFQTKSNEKEFYTRTQGDPDGFCLAWCYLFLEIKLLFKNIDSLKIIDIINKYITEQFILDYKEIDNNQDNKYLCFIRYYAKRLDNQQKKIKKKYKINKNIIYKVDINNDDYYNIVNKINEDIKKYI
jgi:hypothetical protein